MLSDRSCDLFYLVEAMEMGYRDACGLPLPDLLYNDFAPGTICWIAFPTENSLGLEGMEYSEEVDYSECCDVHPDWCVTWKKDRMARCVCCSLDQCSD